MKNTLPVFFIAVLLFCGGCPDRYLKPTSEVCRPLSAFNTIVIAPFDSDSTIVEEWEYKHLPHNIAIATVNQLKDKMEDSRMFGKVAQSSNCMDNAIKVDGKIYSLKHHRNFNVYIRGQIVNCQTGERLYIFENNEQDDEAAKLPGQIAGKLVDAIKAKLTCEEKKL